MRPYGQFFSCYNVGCVCARCVLLGCTSRGPAPEKGGWWTSRSTDCPEMVLIMQASWCIHTLKWWSLQMARNRGCNLLAQSQDRSFPLKICHPVDRWLPFLSTATLACFTTSARYNNYLTILKRCLLVKWWSEESLSTSHKSYSGAVGIAYVRIARMHLRTHAIIRL